MSKVLFSTLLIGSVIMGWTVCGEETGATVASPNKAVTGSGLRPASTAPQDVSLTGVITQSSVVQRTNMGEKTITRYTMTVDGKSYTLAGSDDLAASVGRTVTVVGKAYATSAGAYVKVVSIADAGTK